MGATVDGAFLRELRFKSGRVRLVRNDDGKNYSLRRRSWMQCPLGTAMQVFISPKRNTQEIEDMGTLLMTEDRPKGNRGKNTTAHGSHYNGWKPL